MPIDELPHPNQALRPERAYVLQLGEAAPNAAISGRIEHIASGAAMRFGSLDELFAFLSRQAAPIARSPQALES